MASRSRSGGGAKPPMFDAYVALLLISLTAQIVGAVFFYLDYNAYPSTKPTMPAPPQAAVSGGGPPAGPGPGAQQGVPPGPAGQMAGMPGGMPGVPGGPPMAGGMAGVMAGGRP